MDRQEAVMIITLLCFFFVIASEVFIYVKPKNIYMPLLFCNFFPNMSVPMLLDTKYPLLSYTVWEYAAIIITVCVLCSFFPGASSYVFVDIAFYTSAAVVVSSGWHSFSRQTGSKPPKSTHSLKHLIWYIHVLIRWTSNLNWYSNGTCCYVLASEIQVQLPLKLSFCLRLCRDYKSAFI